MNASSHQELLSRGFCVIRAVLDVETVTELVEHAEMEVETLPHMAHSSSMWRLRTLPQIRQIYEFLYKDRDLITSFDGMSFKVPHMDGLILDYHVDQDQCETYCYQSLIALRPSDATTGSITLLERSHLLHMSILRQHDLDKPRGDDRGWQFVYLGDDKSVLKACVAVQPALLAGDVVVWDSRTVHAVTSAQDAAAVRHVAYVCMVPRNFASQDTLKRRRAAFLRGAASTHWPHRFVSRGDANGPRRYWKTVTPTIAALV